MKRMPTLTEALFPIVSFFVIIIIGYSILGLELPPLIILAAICASFVAFRVGLKWDDMLVGIREKLDSAMPAILILMFIGILIGTWMISGTIPMMMFYGLKLIDPHFLYVIAFFVTLIVSVTIGTSWGSVGTVGLALMGVAHGLDASLAITAGAIVSGAYFGDKMSPMSDTTNLAPVVVGIDLYEHIKHMFYTTVPSAVIAMIVYTIMGFVTKTNAEANSDKLNAILHGLNTMFNWNILLLLPPVIVLYGAIRKKPTIPTFLVSTIVAGLLAKFIEGFSLKNIFSSTIDGFNVSMVKIPGFNPDELSDDVTSLVNQGGLESMFSLIMIIFTAFAYAGIVAKSGCLDVIVQKLMKVAKRTGDLVLTTVISSIIVSCVALTAYLVMIIVGETFKGVYKDKGLAAKNLSRTLEDSGTVVIPLIPWTQASLYIVGVLGVPVLTYAPWAIFCYMGFIFAIIYGYTGFGIAKIQKEEDISLRSDDGSNTNHSV